MKGYENFVEYRELIVDTNELAMEIGFLGSPTIIINGEDLLGLKSYLKPSLCCRFYQNGLPSIDFIRKKIEEEILDYNPSSL